MNERTVIFLTDLSGDLQRGLELASQLAAERAATLVILHVVSLRPQAGEGMLVEAVALTGRGDTERRLRSLVPADPSVPYVHHLEVGDPELRVPALARTLGADLLVVEAERRSRVRRVLERSLPERLLDLCPCPVVTYRPREAGRSRLARPWRGVSRHPAEALDALAGLLEARVDALVVYLEQREDVARRVAESRGVRDAVASLALLREPQPRVARRLEIMLSEYQRAHSALGVELTLPGRTLAALGVCGPEQEGGVSLPVLTADGARAVIVAQARVPGGDGAQLRLTFDARRDFVRVLAQPGPTASTETYAFDAGGLMLSNSRFPEQLRCMGLLPPDPCAQTVRRLRVCEPTPDGSSRLTRMAADAVLGHDGMDGRGYPDYRGVEVIGAWRWVERFGFGVAAEMDLLRG